MTFEEPTLPSGVIPPVCTPLTPDRELDVPSLERLCGFLLDAGVAGLFVSGSTGEAAYLPDEVRLAVLRTVVGVTAGQVPVYAGVIDTSTPRVIAQARAAATQRASAVVATAPFFSPTDATEFGRHFRAIHAAVDLPLIGYDIPSAVGATLPAELVGELARDGVLAAVKDSSGDLDALRELRDAAPDLRLYSGSETLADVSLQLGADGLVPGLGNVDPYGYLRLYRAVTAGDAERAATEQQRLRRLFGIIRIGDRRRMGRYSAAIGGFKESLVRRGIIRYATTSLPMVPLNDTERDAVHRLLADTGIDLTGIDHGIGDAACLG